MPPIPPSVHLPQPCSFPRSMANNAGNIAMNIGAHVLNAKYNWNNPTGKWVGLLGASLHTAYVESEVTRDVMQCRFNNKQAQSRTPLLDAVAKQIASSQSTISPFKAPAIPDPPIAATSTTPKAEAVTPKTTAKKRPRRKANIERQTTPTTLATATKPSRQQRRQEKKGNAFAETPTRTFTNNATPTRTRRTTGRPTKLKMR